MKKINLKKSIIVVGVILIMVALLFFSLIKNKAKLLSKYSPTVEQIGEITIVIKNDTAYIGTDLLIKNHSFIRINIDTLKYKISLFDKPYIQKNQYIGAILKAYKNDKIHFLLKIPYHSINKDLKIVRKKQDSASYEIHITIQYSTIFNHSEYPITKSSKIKIPQPPEIKIEKIKYKKFGWKHIKAVAKIKITNNSDVTLKIKKMSYSMNIKQLGKLNGSLINNIEILPNESSYLLIPIDVKVNRLFKTVFQVLTNKDHYQYTIKLYGILESTDPIKKSFIIDLTENGFMELRK